MAKVTLRKNVPKRIENGHPWVYKNEVENIEGNFEDGDIVEVFSTKRFLGKGYINSKSQILVRLLTRIQHEKIDKEFFRKKIVNAYQHRKNLGFTENYRLFFGEADGIPALVIDCFANHFVIQSLALGVEKWKKEIIEILQEEFKPKGIYERNDVPVRKLEGMEEITGFLSDPFKTDVVIAENGVKFNVDIANGQKTGFFLDQKENRMAIAPYVKGKKVLDCFCHTGSFTLFAAHFGAEKVTAIDISEDAIKNAKLNAELNGLSDKCEFVAANAFDWLTEAVKRGEKYDVVILDPPAFTKSRANVENALKGYKEINLKGMKLLNEGGILITNSCSHFIYPEMLKQVVHEAANNSGRKITEIEYRTQAKDHPIVWGIDETLYLKFFILKINSLYA
jgi:23S rRNA (cytosine1962-C5)-methyltransferase